MTIDLSVVVPIFNEEDSIPHMHRKVVEALETHVPRFEIVFVDDGSSDTSYEVLADLAALDSRVVVVKFRRNYGQTAAMMAGIEYARGDFVATMDGDLQNDPADLPMMYEKIQTGYDMVIGWRMNRQDKWLSRKLPSMVANKLIGKVTGLPVKDNGCSLKVYRGSVIKRVPLYSDMHRFIPAMNLPMGARIAEVGVRHHARQFGESKYGLSRVFKVFLDLIGIKTILLFARQPMRRFSGLATLSALATLLFLGLVFFGDGSTQTGSVMVYTSVAMLTGSLTLFLLLLGSVAALISRQVGPGNLYWARAISGRSMTLVQES
ncbi:MAG: glycosyltransferase family 2 protein [Pseudomonadota bacterium]